MKLKIIASKKLKIEYIVMILSVLVIGILAVCLDMFEKFFIISRIYEKYQLDEIFSFLIVFSFIGMIFSIRRIIDLRIEIQRRENAEERLLNANSELMSRISEIKQLQGIIPICANCKKIRDSEGYWHQVEKYVSQHSEAVFSHSLCEECIDKLYPGLKIKK